MSIENTPAAVKPPLNELARAVVALPLDATFYESPHFVAIVWDGDGHAAIPSILDTGSAGLPYLPAYRLIDHLCGDRAMRTVDGTLRVRQRIVTPESYLGLWRTAMQCALAPEELATQHGLKIVITLGAALAPARLASRVWSSSPFKDFHDLEATYEARFVLGPTASGASGFELALDLRELQAARDAFYGQAMVMDRRDAEGRVSASLLPIRGTGPSILPDASRQPALFEENAA
ncbi:hypothetical protein [Acidovorax sp. SDU_ACID1]|uniref:hypothetical protein n=1 Tax=Acidovorax sp. SDU_ACID1 TaxID=3136632 RepID=UPI003872ABF9